MRFAMSARCAGSLMRSRNLSAPPSRALSGMSCERPVLDAG